MYQILKREGRAKRGRLSTVHGVVETPVFMNVGTVAAIKGAVSTEDLEGIGTQVELSNTYHLHVRPGDKVVRQMGGLHRFMSWNKRVCRSSLIWLPPLPWHLMSVLPVRRTGLMCRLLWSVPPGGWNAAGRKWGGLTAWRTLLIKSRCFSASIRGRSMRTFGLNMPSASGSWNWTATPWEGWRWVRPIRKCIISWRKLYHICRQTSPPI